MNLDKESVLSLNECEQIIKSCLRSDQFTISDCEVGPFSDSVNGFMSEYLLVRINFVTNDGKQTRSFFAKRFPYQHEFHSRYAISVGAFPNEIFTYQVLLGKFKECTGFSSDFMPACYYARDDLIVFENLDEQDYVIHNSPNALPLDHLELCLELLAKYHAGSVAYQELKSKELNKKYRLIDDYQKFMQEPLFRKDEDFLGYHWFKARKSALITTVDLLQIPGIAPEDFKHKLIQLGEDSFEIIKPQDTFYNVICHVDMWAKNFLFRYQNDENLVDAKIIDFQLQRYCPPAHDVLQLLFLAMSSKRRQRHLHSLLRHYHHCLRAELKKSDLDIDKIIPYSDFESSVNYLLPQIKLQTAYYYGFQGANQEFHKNLKGNADNFRKFVFEDGAPFAEELIKTDPNYKILLEEALIELRILVTHDIVSLEDCYKIVETKLGTTDYELEDYFMLQVHGISGFLGDHYRLKIILGDRTLDLFAKCAPKSNTRFNLATAGKVFMKECFVLETLFPMIQDEGIDDVNECIVPHYLIRVNDVIVFDDLSFRGFRACSQRVPFTFDELQVIVRKLAIYHASNIALEEKRRFRLESFKDELEESFFPTDNHTYCSLSIKLGVDTVPYQLKLFSELDFPEGFEEKVREAFEVCYQLVKPSEVYRNVVCHGDLWADNIMMKYDCEKAIDCRIIDYQILRYCPPAHDLLTLLYLTTTKAIRSQCMKTLIDFYYTIFANVLKRQKCNVESIYTYELFLESCEHYVPQAVCQTVLFYHFTMTSPKLMNDYIKDEKLTRRIFTEERTDFIKDMCGKDPMYRARMRESLEDLKDMCLKYF